MLRIAATLDSSKPVHQVITSRKGCDQGTVTGSNYGSCASAITNTLPSLTNLDTRVRIPARVQSEPALGRVRENASGTRRGMGSSPTATATRRRIESSPHALLVARALVPVFGDQHAGRDPPPRRSRSRRTTSSAQARHGAVKIPPASASETRRVSAGHVRRSMRDAGFTEESIRPRDLVAAADERAVAIQDLVSLAVVRSNSPTTDCRLAFSSDCLALMHARDPARVVARLISLRVRASRAVQTLRRDCARFFGVHSAIDFSLRTVRCTPVGPALHVGSTKYTRPTRFIG